MSKKIVDVYTNDVGEKITKVEDINGTTLVESFVNSENNLEYSKYILEDGGVIDMDTKDLDKEGVITLYDKTLEQLLVGEDK